MLADKVKRVAVWQAAAAAAAAFAVAGCGSSSHHRTSKTVAVHSVTASAALTTMSVAKAGTLSVVLHAPTTEPKVGVGWPITVEAHTPAGKPVNGTVSYAFIFGGAVVARRPGGQMREGVFHDHLEFPAQAVGYPLTLEVIVEGEGSRGSTRRPVKAER